MTWLILVTAAFLLLRRPSQERGSSRLLTLSPAGILLIAGIVRLAPAALLPVGAGYDIESYQLVTDALLSGREVYSAVLGRHPYLPFQMYIMAGSAYFAQITGLPYIVAIKLPAIVADIALTGLIFRASAQNGDRAWATYVALLYALNPVSLLVTSYHGQFEAVTLLLLTASWYWWHTGRGTASPVALGLAILNKTWPVVFLPVYFIRLKNWRSRMLTALIALGIPILFVGLYLIAFSADPAPMLRRALTHRGVPGYWGPGAVFSPAALSMQTLQPFVDALFALRNWLLLAAVLAALWLTRRQTALDAFLTTILGMFAVTVGFGIQWLLWPVPFALLAGEDGWVRRFSLAAGLMLAVHLFGLHMAPLLSGWLPPATADWFIRLSGLPAWIVVIAWLIERLRRAQLSMPDSGRLRESPLF